MSTVHALLVPLYAAAGLACAHAARGRTWRAGWSLLALAAASAAVAFALRATGHAEPLLDLGTAGLLALAALGLLRSILPGARRELLFDGGVLGLGVATIWLGFLVVPALDGPTEAVAAALLLAVAASATVTAAVCSATIGRSGGHGAIERLFVAQVLQLVSALGGTGAIADLLTLGLSALAVVSAVLVRPRTAVAQDPEDDGADDPVRRHLLAPIACVTVFPLSLALLLAVRGPSVGEIALWATTWSLGALLVFARQNWLVGDRHRAVARERDVRRDLARRNVELEALTDLADAMTRLSQERDLVARGLHILGRAADARSVHIDLAGELHVRPAGAAPPAEDDASALRLPIVVRGERLGTVLLACGRPPGADTQRLLALIVDQLALGISHVRDYSEKTHQALRDPLTGIYNRRVLQDALARELLRAARDDGQVSLTLLDIDDFKKINDVHGHDAGDEVLRRVAACGREVVRPGDTLARIGGEEFALLTPGAGAREALRVAERLRLAVAGLDVLPDRAVTVSAGLATWPLDAADGDALRRAADEALYRAKGAGKNRCELAGGAPSLA